MTQKDQNTRITMGIQGIMALGIVLWSSLFTPGLSSETAALQKPSIPQKDFQLNVGAAAENFGETDPKDAKAALKVWIDTLFKKKKGELGGAELYIYPDLTSMINAAQQNQLDLIFLTPEDYLKVKSDLSFDPIATTTSVRGTTSQFSVLVRKDRGILKLGDLRSKSLLVQKGENHRLLCSWLETVTMKEGYPALTHFFPNLKEVNTTSRAILPVFFGQADSCVAYRAGFETMIEMNPQLGKELILITSSPEYARGIICIGKKAAKQYPWVVDEMLSIHKEPQAKQIFTLMRIGRMIPFESGQLATVEALLREHKSLKMKLARGG